MVRPCPSERSSTSGSGSEMPPVLATPAPSGFAKTLRSMQRCARAKLSRRHRDESPASRISPPGNGRRRSADARVPRPCAELSGAAAAPDRGLSRRRLDRPGGAHHGRVARRTARSIGRHREQARGRHQSRGAGGGCLAAGRLHAPIRDHHERDQHELPCGAAVRLPARPRAGRRARRTAVRHGGEPIRAGQDRRRVYRPRQSQPRQDQRRFVRHRDRQSHGLGAFQADGWHRLGSCSLPGHRRGVCRSARRPSASCVLWASLRDGAR